MRVVAKVVAAIACSMGVLFFLMGVLTGKLMVVNGLIFAIGMIVAIVPEGLLPTLSLSLALAGQRMAGKNALVKKLSAVETLGAATVICTDKTGTLTTNEMMVERVWLRGATSSVRRLQYKPGAISTGREAPCRRRSCESRPSWSYSDGCHPVQ